MRYEDYLKRGRNIGQELYTEFSTGLSSASRSMADSPASNARIRARRSVCAGIGLPMTIRMVPGRLRNARRPQHRPESVDTGITGIPVRDATAAMPDCNTTGLPGSLRVP